MGHRVGKGRAALKRRRENALANLLTNKNEPVEGGRTAAQKEQEITTLKSRVQVG